MFRSFGNSERLVPTTPEALKSVMSDNSYDFEKPSKLRKFLVRVLGEGLIISEGDLHKFQRKHLLPAFQIQHIRELYPVFWGKSRSLVEGIERELVERSRSEWASVIRTFLNSFALERL
jgi:cytochrome P450